MSSTKLDYNSLNPNSQKVKFSLKKNPKPEIPNPKIPNPAPKNATFGTLQIEELERELRIQLGSWEVKKLKSWRGRPKF